MVIVQMLDGLPDETGEERIGFKGGAALELRFGFRSRASRDLDGAYRGEVTEAIQLIDQAVRRGWHGFTGSATEGEPILNAGLSLPPIRFRVKLLYKQKES
jgi:predicted nucleotidyltransferase component of viral defense system